MPRRHPPLGPGRHRRRAYAKRMPGIKGFQVVPSTSSDDRINAVSPSFLRSPCFGRFLGRLGSPSWLRRLLAAFPALAASWPPAFGAFACRFALWPSAFGGFAAASWPTFCLCFLSLVAGFVEVFCGLRLCEDPVDRGRHLVDRRHAVDGPQQHPSRGSSRSAARSGADRPQGGFSAPPDRRPCAAARRAPASRLIRDLDAAEQRALVDLEFDHPVEVEALLVQHAGRAPRPARPCAGSRRG